MHFGFQESVAATGIDGAFVREEEGVGGASIPEGRAQFRYDRMCQSLSPGFGSDADATDDAGRKAVIADAHLPHVARAVRYVVAVVFKDYPAKLLVGVFYARILMAKARGQKILQFRAIQRFEIFLIKGECLYHAFLLTGMNPLDIADKIP
jgi:hypothetical protein